MEIVGNEIYEAENPKVIREARHFSDVRFTEVGIKKEKLICLELSTKDAITFKEFMKGFEEKSTERR